MSEKHTYTEDDAERDLPALQQWSNRLTELAQRAIASERMRLTSSPFRLMCLTFLSRQIDNVASLIALHGHRDMTLVARSMVEGMVILMWVSRDPEARASLWRDFAFVHDWRMFRRHRREGRPVPDEDWSRVLAQLESLGPKYYTSKNLRRLQQGQQPSEDPYRWSWLDIKWRQLFTEAQVPEWYDRFYAPFSDWHHWGAASLVQSIRHTEEGVVFSSSRVDDTVYALLIAISSLHVTLQVADWEMKLDLAAQLEQYREEFEEWHRSRGARWGIPFIRS